MCDERLKDKIRGCFAGVAVGDALGMPWELCSHDEILALTGGVGVTGLQDIPAGRERRIKDLRGLKLGETTDDWMLTRAVAESLIRCRGFDIADQAAAHVEAYETSTKGWGGTTKESIAELKRWFDTRGREGRRPGVAAGFSKPNRGTGNGVLMKLSPMAVGMALKKIRIEHILELEALTHHEMNARGIALVLSRCLTDNVQDGVTPFALQLSQRDFGLPEVAHLFDEEGADEDGLPSADEVRRALGCSSKATESGPFSVATFLRHPRDIRGGILEAINAGGDTDTNAAIVGSMIGAHVGLSEIPSEWIEAVPDAKIAIEVADRFIAAFSA